MTRVLLTGATGFVGRQVLRALGEQGAVVRVVVRAGRAEAVEALPAIERIVETPALFAEPADWWARTCEGADTVVHAAWYAVPGLYLNAPENLDCLRGTLALAQGAARAEVGRFVGVGTCFEYRMGPDDLDVTTPLEPTTPYAAAKAAAYLALSRALPAQGVALAWCRLFYLYGEGEDPRRLVRHIRDRIEAGERVELTSGTQIRDFMDVADVGRRLAEIALGDGQGPMNVCSGDPITVRRLAEDIADGYGRRDLLVFGARADNAVDPPRVVGFPTLTAKPSAGPM